MPYCRERTGERHNTKKTVSVTACRVFLRHFQITHGNTHQQLSSTDEKFYNKRVPKKRHTYNIYIYMYIQLSTYIQAFCFSWNTTCCSNALLYGTIGLVPPHHSHLSSMLLTCLLDTTSFRRSICHSYGSIRISKKLLRFTITTDIKQF